MTKKYDVFGVGNALVDTLASIEHDFLHKAEIKKGVMKSKQAFKFLKIA